MWKVTIPVEMSEEIRELLGTASDVEMVVLETRPAPYRIDTIRMEMEEVEDVDASEL